jgi:hypothetical protein
MDFVGASFRELFCRYYHCRTSEYELQALFRLVHRDAQTLARMIWKVNPAFFSADFEILNLLGTKTSREEVLSAAQSLESEYRDRTSFGCVRRAFNLWLSPDQVIYTAVRLWPSSCSSRRAGILNAGAARP